MKKQSFEVQHLHCFDRWENTWTEGDDEVPVTFSSRVDAQDAIDNLIADSAHFDMPYKASEYRIVEILVEVTQLN